MSLTIKQWLSGFALLVNATAGVYVLLNAGGLNLWAVLAATYWFFAGLAFGELMNG